MSLRDYGVPKRIQNIVGWLKSYNKDRRIIENVGKINRHSELCQLATILSINDQIDDFLDCFQFALQNTHLNYEIFWNCAHLLICIHPVKPERIEFLFYQLLQSCYIPLRHPASMFMSFMYKHYSFHSEMWIMLNNADELIDHYIVDYGITGEDQLHLRALSALHCMYNIKTCPYIGLLLHKDKCVISMLFNRLEFLVVPKITWTTSISGREFWEQKIQVVEKYNYIMNHFFTRMNIKFNFICDADDPGDIIVFVSFIMKLRDFVETIKLSSCCIDRLSLLALDQLWKIQQNKGDMIFGIPKTNVLEQCRHDQKKYNFFMCL
jgi:hypothetical protein